MVQNRSKWLRKKRALESTFLRVTVASVKYHYQRQLEERVYLTYAFTTLFIMEEGQDRNLNMVRT